MNYTEAFLSPELVRALGWTILHSLWQGALVALALSALLVFLNRHSAQVRYFVSVTALLTMLALAAFTFVSLYQPEPATPVAASQITKIPAAALPAPDSFSTQNPSIFPTESNWREQFPLTGFFSNYFEKHLPLLVTFWFLGLLVMALKMLGGLAYVQRLRHYQTRPLQAQWQQKLELLQTRLNLQKPVQLLESARVKVPMALGFLKPVILVPLGALNGLSEKQVEAILAHELAHITRHDYLFNLLQTFIETVFFFHPGVWWVSASVRAERENCCDDIALSLCGDSLAFAGALAELEEMNFAAGPALAMAFTGRRGSLLSRIKRLVAQPKRSASFSEGFMAACILMVSLSVVSLSAMAQLRPDIEEFPAFIVNPVLAKAEPARDLEKPAATPPGNVTPAEKMPLASPAPAAVLAAEPDFSALGYQLSVSKAPDGNGDDIIIVKDKKGRIVELYVDGKKVRKKDLPAFQRIIDERSGIAGRGKTKKKDYASREDVAEAKEALRQTNMARGRGANVYVYEHPAPAPAGRYHYNYSVPAPPSPPSPAIWIAPMAPMRPMKPMKPMQPMRPMKPMKPVAPLAGDPEKEKQAYEKELKGYEKELKQYEKEMAEYTDRNSRDWKDFERAMQLYSKEMEEYGRQIAANATTRVQGYYAEGSRGVDSRHLEKALERAAEARERAAEARAKAAVEREKAAEERAKAAVLRAKAAEERAKAAKERNERMEQLKTELRKDNLIGADEKNFVYKISNEGLYVNNKKQPDETFEKYKKLFHPGFTGKGNYNEMYMITNDGNTTIINNDAGTATEVGGKTKVQEEKKEVKAEKNKAKVKTEKKK